MSQIYLEQEISWIIHFKIILHDNLKGLCPDTFDLFFVHGSNPSRLLINRLNYSLEIVSEFAEIFDHKFPKFWLCTSSKVKAYYCHQCRRYTLTALVQLTSSHLTSLKFSQAFSQTAMWHTFETKHTGSNPKEAAHGWLGGWLAVLGSKMQPAELAIVFRPRSHSFSSLISFNFKCEFHR